MQRSQRIDVLPPRPISRIANFASRLKTPNGLATYDSTRKIRTSEPERFILDPIHQMPGLNTGCVTATASETRMDQTRYTAFMTLCQTTPYFDMRFIKVGRVA